MTKREVCEYLGKSIRTVAEYIASGKLPATYINGKNGREARFDRAEVEHLKNSLDTPMVRAVPAAAGSTEVAVRPDPLAGLAAHFQTLAAPPQVKPWLTIEEAVAYSGLTRAWLLKEADAGQGSIAIRDMGRGAHGGRWRFLRDDLGKAE
jgi:excisionase family DNA binding protein